MSNKYIYVLYRASDGRYNVEQRTIIYQNSKYVYIKSSNNGYELKGIDINNLIESIEYVDHSYFTNKMFYGGTRYLKHYDKIKDKKILDARSNGKCIRDIESDLSKISNSIEVKEMELKRLREESSKLQSKLLELEREKVNMEKEYMEN